MKDDPLDYDPRPAEAMIALAFAQAHSEELSDQGPGQLSLNQLSLNQRSGAHPQVWDQLVPLIPTLAVPEVLAIAVRLIQSVVTVDSGLEGAAAPTTERAQTLFRGLRAEGYTAQEVAAVGAVLLIQLVRLFPV